MNDQSGRVTGAPQKLKEATLTGTYALASRLSLWLEFRNDWSNRPFFNRGSQLGNWKTQPTLLLGMVALLRPAK